MDVQRVNQTISYYNNNAEEYYENTKNVDFSDTYARFLKYIPEGGKIADLGCGSGRDTAHFSSKGYQAFGVDASEELATIATRNAGIKVIVSDMSTWQADEPLDGIWCCASLLHLNDDEITTFFNNIPINLKPDGAMFLSVKIGEKTGIDDKGRYVKYFSIGEIESLIKEAELVICDEWFSSDKIGRAETKWINIISKKRI